MYTPRNLEVYLVRYCFGYTRTALEVMNVTRLHFYSCDVHTRILRVIL